MYTIYYRVYMLYRGMNTFSDITVIITIQIVHKCAGVSIEMKFV